MDLLLSEPSAEAQDQQEQHGSHAGEAAIRSPAKQNKYFIRLLTVPFQLEEKTNCHCQQEGANQQRKNCLFPVLLIPRSYFVPVKEIRRF